eukprot:269194-Pelagomonas_calceolata.AAC.4
MTTPSAQHTDLFMHGDSPDTRKVHVTAMSRHPPIRLGRRQGSSGDHGNKYIVMGPMGLLAVLASPKTAPAKRPHAL